MDASVLAPVAALFGLIFGSFINVVAHRVPADKSVVSPPSACPACDHPIRARDNIPADKSVVSPPSACPACDHPIRVRDNIPVLSWLLLRGRCRDCGARISARYPIVEAATAGLFATTVLVIGIEPELPAYLWFVGVALTLVLTDIDVHRLPNRILYPSTVIGSVLLFGAAIVDADIERFWRAVAGGGCYFVLFFILALLARGGFGLGDVKLAFFLGLFLTYQSWDVLGAGIALGIAIGGVWAIALLLARRATRKAKIAFGPAMIFGAYLALAIGQQLVDWYLGR